MLDLLLTNCANVVVPEATEQAMSYYRGGNLLWLIAQAWTFLVPLLFLFTGFSGRLGKFATRKNRSWFLGVAIYLAVYVSLNTILDLPLDYYSGFMREHSYGLSTQELAGWVKNWGIGLILSLIFALSFVWIFYLLLKRSPRRWWIYSSITAIAITFFLSFIQPIWIDPLFNDFGPMKNKQLEEQILNLAARAGIQNGRVFEVNKSQETKTLNAYVVGFGQTNRIVLWDTTIERMTPDQILFVMGHEMGHYVLHHMWWGFAFFSAIITLVFYLTYKSVYYILKRYKSRFGFHDMANIASFPLLVLCLSFFLFLTGPLQNYFSRTIEHHADQFGLEITQNNQAAGEAFVVLQEDNLANPRPGLLYKTFRCSHPPLAERVAFCNTYCPWVDGQPLKYGRFFDQPSSAP